jgi:hypothetical protein
MLIAQSTIKPLHSSFSPHLLSTTSAHPCYIYVAQKEEANMKSYEDVLALGVRNPQSTACDVWRLCLQDKT